MLRRTLAFALLPILLLAGGCGDDKADVSTDNQSGSGSTTMAPSGPTNPAAAGSSDDALKAITDRGKPKVTVPPEPATELKIIDDVEGTGAEVQADSTVTAHYVGVGQQSGEQFDASWDNGGQPIQFPLNRVIEGWQKGLVGMKVGGRRTLIIPGEMAYGPNPPPGIQPNETLVFTVDLVSVDS